MYSIFILKKKIMYIQKWPKQCPSGPYVLHSTSILLEPSVEEPHQNKMDKYAEPTRAYRPSRQDDSLLADKGNPYGRNLELSWQIWFVKRSTRYWSVSQSGLLNIERQVYFLLTYILHIICRICNKCICSIRTGWRNSYTSVCTGVLLRSAW
jgi:hypothetical protein